MYPNAKNFLNIIVRDDHTLIEYVCGENVIVEHRHDFGIKHLEKETLSKIAFSKFIDGILYVLEHISLYERIPTDFRLTTPRYVTLLKDKIEKESYTQFFTNNVPIRVTINDNKDILLNYAGHKKISFNFKV